MTTSFVHLPPEPLDITTGDELAQALERSEVERRWDPEAGWFEPEPCFECCGRGAVFMDPDEYLSAVCPRCLGSCTERSA
jgi:hypothetical protein